MSTRHDPGPFRFKQFAVAHTRSSMRVGVDGVLTGAWADMGRYITETPRMLDAGTGCGVIALMLAQRFPTALIDAIDIDAASIEEARSNFNLSPWSTRLTASLTDYASLAGTRCRYDLIASNPPYFSDGIYNPATPREVARHQASLSPAGLLACAGQLLTPQGRLCLVLPYSQADALIAEAALYDMTAIERLDIAGRPDLLPKRTLLAFGRAGDTDKSQLSTSIATGRLDIESATGIYTNEYRQLTKEFYLNF